MIDKKFHKILPSLPSDMYPYILASPNSTPRMKETTRLGLSVIEHKTSPYLDEIKDMNLIGMAMLIGIKHSNFALAKSLYAKHGSINDDITYHAHELCTEVKDIRFRSWAKDKFKPNRFHDGWGRLGLNI